MLWSWHSKRKGLVSAKSRTPVTHYAGGWVDPRAGLDVCGEEKILPQPGFEPRTIQPVATRCTDYAISPLPPRFECTTWLSVLRMLVIWKVLNPSTCVSYFEVLHKWELRYGRLLWMYQMKGEYPTISVLTWNDWVITWKGSVLGVFVFN
jgi:hypothetical protein